MACTGHGDCHQGRAPCRTPLTCSGMPADQAIERFNRERPIRPLTFTRPKALNFNRSTKGAPVSAQPTNVLPFPGEKPKTIDDLVVLWIDAKRDEDAANARRVAIEAEICKVQPPKEEGSTTVDLAGGVKLTLTGKLTYKCTDMAALQALALQLPPDRRPVKTEAKLDETGCKWLRANAPDLWKVVAPAIEVRPAKTGFKVGF